jgi:Mn2+/Fe2+ NRAMP family transporter
MIGPPDNVGQRESERKEGGIVRALGPGLITGAADDDCSAIGTYASAGARCGPELLWTAPVTLPMMYIVVYLSSKLGQVSGRGLFKSFPISTRVGCYGLSWRAY